MLILMADGSQKKAGDLKVGDLVKTYDEKDLEKAKKLVRNKSLVLSTGGSEKLSEFREQLENSYVKASLGEYKVEFMNIVKNVEKIKFTFEGSEIICSSTHKFYVNNAWKEAKNMVIGDKVSGKKLLSTEDVENGDVVHITVEDAHTYICEGLLSHNKRRLPPRTSVEDIREGGRKGGGRRPPRDKARPPRGGDVPRPTPPKRPEKPQRPQEEEEDRGFGGRGRRRRRRVRDRRDRRARLRRRRQALRRARRRRRINRSRFGRRK